MPAPIILSGKFKSTGRLLNSAGVPNTKSNCVVYGDGLNSDFSKSRLFFTSVTLNCVVADVKLSTKNPDLNLFNPFASGINKFSVFVSRRESVE